MSRPRILLADDNPGVIQRVKGVLCRDFDVVGVVADGQAALDAWTALRPDVVLFDISMPVMNGLEAARRLSASEHPPCIVFLTIHEDPQFVDAARQAGAHAYVFKRNIGCDLVRTIHLALDGRTVFPGELQALPIPEPL
jgi:DNA-binding NarL/FixJ family response regulator